MTNISGTNLAAPVVPFTTEDDFATHLAQYGKGGWHSVTTITERNAIPDKRLELGMSVYVTGEGKLYVLTALDTTTTPYTKTWTEFTSGGGSGSTYMPFPNSWTTNSTTKALCDDIAADSTATVGNAYLGEVTLSDLPAGIGNAEVRVEIMDGTTAANKVIVLTMSSGNVAPYLWQYVYWDGGASTSGWQGFTQTTVTFRTWTAN